LSSVIEDWSARIFCEDGVSEVFETIAAPEIGDRAPRAVEVDAGADSERIPVDDGT